MATAGDIAKAVNGAGWLLKENNDDRDLVTAGNVVNFVDGTATTVSITTKDNVSEVKYNTKFDGKTITTNSKGELTAVIPEIKQTTGIINANGSVSVYDADPKTFLNASETAKLINGASHTVKGSNSNQQVTATDGSVKIKPGDTLTIEAGKNLNASMKDGKLALSTAPNVQFDTVQVEKGLTVAPKANIDMGGNQIHNVAPGTKPTDAVNVSQLKGSLGDIADDASAGIAGAAAMGMIAQPNESGEAIIGAGIGYHRGQAALAVGMTATSDNNNWIIKGAVGVDTQKQATAGFSVNYKIW